MLLTAVAVRRSHNVSTCSISCASELVSLRIEVLVCVELLTRLLICEYAHRFIDSLADTAVGQESMVGQAATAGTAVSLVVAALRCLCCAPRIVAATAVKAAATAAGTVATAVSVERGKLYAVTITASAAAVKPAVTAAGTVVIAVRVKTGKPYAVTAYRIVSRLCMASARITLVSSISHPGVLPSFCLQRQQIVNEGNVSCVQRK